MRIAKFEKYLDDFSQKTKTKMNAQSIYTELTDIKEKYPDAFTDEEWEAVELNKEQVMVLKMIAKTKDTYYQKIENELFHKEQKKKAWKEAHAEISNEGHSSLQLLQLLTELGYGGIKEFRTKQEGKVGVKADWITCKYLCRLVRQDKERAEKAYEEEVASKTKTKKKKKSGNVEKNYVNTPEDPEGKDNKFYFKGDEDVVFEKPSYTSKDGKTQNIKYKAVKSTRYLGGEKSSPDDIYCCGVVSWDRACASNAIKDTGISPAMFKVRCSEVVGGNSFCDKCSGKGLDFFTSTYQLGKNAKGNKFNGTTYQDFIINELEYA